ncbi:MAG: ECF transporter S component [Alloprevotella sp.]
MQTTRLYSLTYDDRRTYLAATLFVVGNILLPQLFHLFPDGGKIWLPLYFFTLVGAYKFGWQVGLLTATVSPLASSLLFGMPGAAVLPGILLKSVLLAVAAALVAHRSQRASLALLALVVLTYQVLGTLGEWLLTGSLDLALQDFRMGIPGMLLQLFGGWWFIHYFLRK